MGYSIGVGVGARPDASGWLILPGDMPQVQPVTLQAVARQLAHHAVVYPQYKGRRGHPVRFSAACRPELLNLKGNSGAAQILRLYAAINSVAYMEVDDCGVVTDIDTLDDLQRAEALLARRL